MIKRALLVAIVLLAPVFLAGCANTGANSTINKIWERTVYCRDLGAPVWSSTKAQGCGGTGGTEITKAEYDRERNLWSEERKAKHASLRHKREKERRMQERISRERLEEERISRKQLEVKRERKELLAKQAREREKVEREKRAKQSRSQTCLDFGFKEGSDPHSQCMFDLFMLEQSAAQNLAMQQKLQTMQAEAVDAEERYNRKLRLLEKEIENKEVAQAYQREVQAMRDEAARKAASQNALLEKHLRQFNEQLQAERNFQEGMQMLQYGLDMIDPPRTTTKCQWNAIMQIMTCN